MAIFSVVYFKPWESPQKKRNVLFNKQVRISTDTTAIKQFLEEHPEGPLSDTARARLDSLRFSFDFMDAGVSVIFCLNGW